MRYSEVDVQTCRVQWFEKYICGLSDFQLQKIEESESTSTFTFGDGVTIASFKNVKLPCCVGRMKADITTDVVDDVVSLLLSNKAMRKVKLCRNFGKGTATVGNSTIKPRSSVSGHYCSPSACDYMTVNVRLLFSIARMLM